MTTVSVTTPSSAPYTWDSLADKDWTDAESSKAWEDAAIRTIQVAAGEPLTATEVASKVTGKTFAETFSAMDGDKVVRQMVMNQLVELGVSSSYIDQISFLIRALENLSVTEGHVKQIGLSKLELVGVTESGFSKQIQMTIRQAVGFAEVFGRAVVYKRKLAESFSAAEAWKKAITVKKGEALTAFDEYLRRGNAVISDMLLLDSAITFEDFKQILDGGIVPGYVPFRDFIPGDYEYQTALFRAVLQSSNSDRARLSQFRVDVDVPDIIETGTAIITNASAGLRINFTRTFHVVPEITMNLRGGSVIAIPDLLGDADLLGFTAILRDMTDTRVTGTVTWAAHGY